MKISLVQMETIAANPEANLKKAETFIAEAAQLGSQLVCLPEMWTTGFDWDYIDRSYDKQRQIHDTVSEMAKKYSICINGSILAVNEKGKPTNTSILFDGSGGLIATYSKAHLFRLIDEDKHLYAGDALTLAQCLWGKTGLAICYDLRFPELFRSYALAGAKIVLLSAAFPYPRIEHWRTLLRARAIENQFFMVATNRVGKEGDISFFGASTVIDPWGETVIEAPEGEETLVTSEIVLERVDEVRSKMQVLADRRPEIYRLD